VDKGSLYALYSLLVIRRDYKSCLTSNVSYSVIHEKFGWGDTKISKSLQILEDLGVIDRHSGHGNDKNGVTNIYAFPLEKFTYGGKEVNSELPPALKQKQLEKKQKLEETQPEQAKATESEKAGNSLSKADLLAKLKKNGEESI